MKKGIKFATASFLALSAITPVAAFAAEENVVEQGIYTTAGFYTFAEFQKLSTAEKLAILQDDSSVIVVGEQAIPGQLILEGSDDDIEAIEQTPAEYAEENNVEFTNEGLQTQGEPDPTLDTAALDAAKASAADLVEADYTEESWAALQEALEAANAFEVTEETTQAEVDAVVAALEAAITALEEVEEVTELAVESVSAINKTTVEVTFSTEVDSVTGANFSIEGATVNSAKLSEDKKSARLDVSGLNYGTEYTVVVKDVLVNGELQENASKAFTTPAISELWDLQVTSAKESIIANGVDNTVVTFSLVDKVTGEVDVNVNDMVLDLNTTYGSLAQKRVTIQNGTASVIIRSEFIAQGATAKIDAQIIEASGDYKELIGQVVGTGQVVFTPSGSGEVATTTLTSANTNEADRVTLTFDKDVSLGQFIKLDDDGRLTRDLEGVVEIKQGNTPKTIVGFIPGNTSNTVIAVLDKETPLTDNADVKVVSTLENSSGDSTYTEKDFKFTDARTPNITSVSPEGLNTLVVKFSEPVDKATFLIDGKFKQGTDFDVLYGDFGFDSDLRQFVDERHIATIILTGYQEPDKVDNKYVYTEGYFKPGKHALQVSSIYDFAALSDPKNIGTTQNLSFEIAEDNAVATASVKVDSPEQFRVTFDKKVAVDATNLDNFELQVYNAQSKKWDKATDVFKDDGDKKALTYKVTPIPHSPVKGKLPEYKVELTVDWTEVYKTSATKDNYYNDKFRLVLPKETVQTVANGKLNTNDIVLELSTVGSPLVSPDTTSPKISDIERVEGTTNQFVVTMDEPVKLFGLDEEDRTLAEGQDDLPETKVEFIGKDKDGKTRTFIGEVGTYTTDGLDTKFTVNWKLGETTPQTIVNDGGSTDWTVVVKSISDDVGNTAATVTRAFTIEKDAQQAGKFMVAYTNGEDATAGYKIEGAEGDTITITFTDTVALTGIGSVIDPANFTLNGKELPVGTSIALVPDADAIDDNTIKITVDKGTLGATNVISLGRNLTSKDDKELEGAYTFTFVVQSIIDAQKAEAAQQALDNATAGLIEDVEAFVQANVAGNEITLSAPTDAEGNSLGDTAVSPDVVSEFVNAVQEQLSALDVTSIGGTPVAELADTLTSKLNEKLTELDYAEIGSGATYEQAIEALVAVTGSDVTINVGGVTLTYVIK